MKNIIKNTLYLALGIILIIIAAGIYKFNFTDSDMYIEKDGKIIPMSVIQEGKLNIVTSIVPLTSIANYIGGEHVNVTSLVPAGISPHNFDITPKQMVSISDSDMIIGIGLEHIDGFLDKVISKKRSISVSNGIELIDGGENSDHDEHEEDSHDEHEEDNHTKDPHIWLSPNNSIIIAEKIKNQFIKVHGEKQLYYEENFNNFIREINTIVSEFKKENLGKQVQDFILLHDAYNYLFRDLGIDKEKKHVFQKSVMSNPNISEIKILIDDISTHNIRLVYKEPQFQSSYLEGFASDYNLEVFSLDPLGTDTSSSGYIDNLKNNINNLKKIYE